MKKMGKFERKARRQEYHTALGILAHMQEHLEAGEVDRAKAYIEFWDQTYTEWLEDLDQQDQEEARK